MVYVSGSYCAAWAADSSILPLVLLLSLAYISGGGVVNYVPSRALLTFGVFHYKAFLSKVPFSCVVKLVVFLGVSGFAVYDSY